MVLGTIAKEPNKKHVTIVESMSFDQIADTLNLNCDEDEEMLIDPHN